MYVGVGSDNFSCCNKWNNSSSSTPYIHTYTYLPHTHKDNLLWHTMSMRVQDIKLNVVVKVENNKKQMTAAEIATKAIMADEVKSRKQQQWRHMSMHTSIHLQKL